ncbi:(Fe-S)-binding protein [Ampullimonas aquatilis]|uniref:(Fe-S)-binding protein n=1 Tax=Ampullimonas aquatilis TaxID=1341549 RepID=UPI003C74DF67
MKNPDKSLENHLPKQIYFFATCVIDMFMPQAGMDAITVLQQAGIHVEFPQAQSCCGQPAYTSGFPEEARRVAAAQLDLFPEDFPIVVPSGSCGGMIKHHWPKLFADDPAQLAKAQAIAARVVEFSELVLQFPDTFWSTATPQIQKIVLHTSCSARREMGSLTTGVAVLRKLPGVQLQMQDHESECCGFGGTFSVKHPAVSAAMAEDKLAAIRATGCEQFVSADCGCLLNLNHTLEKQGDSLRGVHIASLIKQSLAVGKHDE